MPPCNNAVLIGYFPKRIESRPELINAPQVLHIYSVSECISKGPDDWIGRWLHNAMWCFDSPELAAQVVPPEVAGELEILAYRLIPRLYDEQTVTAMVLPKLAVQPLDNRFEFLGFDAVERFIGPPCENKDYDTDSFSCSPLSCNHAAEHEAANAFCLIDDEAEIMRLAQHFATAANGFEPGPYCIVEVWRQKRQPS